MTDNRSDGIFEAAVTEVPGTDDLVASSKTMGVAHVDADESIQDDDWVDPELKKGRGRAVVALAASSAIDNSEGGVVNTVFPLLIEAFGIDRSQLGIISSISKFARGILGPTWAMLADRFGKKLVLFIVTGLWGFWTVGTGFAPDFTWFLILYSIAVLGTVASEPILNGLMADLFSRNERGKAFGSIRGAGQLVGMLLTPAIAAFGAEGFRNPETGVHDGWRYAMWTMGALSIVSGLLILMWVKEPKKSATKVADDPDAGIFKLSDGFKLFKIPTYALLALMLPLVTSMVLFAFMQTFWVQINGFTVPEAGLLYTVFAACSVVGSILGGLFADQMVQKFGHKGRILMMQLYLASFAAVTFLGFYPNWGTAWYYWVIVGLVGLVFPIGWSACVLPMVSSIVPAQLNATGFAMLFSLVQGLITAVMTILVGYISETDLGFQNTIAIFVSGAYALNAVYWFVFYKTYPKDVARQKERTAQVAAGTF
ncbi:MAG TPA: MFS transporter [Actinomycetaceae bacterium]|nr:MFS transporter [Actinomycetaceae bacterium]